MKSFVRLTGEISAITGQLITMITRREARDRKSQEMVTYEAAHPVVVPKDVAEKLAVGKRLHVFAELVQVNNRTVAAATNIKAAKKSDPDKNEAGLLGDICWNRTGYTNSGRPALTIGIGDRGELTGMFYSVIYGADAAAWDTLLREFELTVSIEGRMQARSFERRNGEVSQMYELIAVDGAPKRIVGKTKKLSGFEKFAPLMGETAALAFEIDPEAVPSAVVSPATVPTSEPASYDPGDDIPF